jgi:hypothetical protein
MIISYPWTVQKHLGKKHNQASHGKGGGGLQATIKTIEDEIVKNSFETLVVLDRKGNEIIRRQGKPNQVRVSMGEQYYDMEDTIILHNHPERTTFSSNDIQVFVNSQAQETRVVDDKYLYSMRRKDTPRSKFYMKKIQPEEVRAVEKGHRERWSQDVIDGVSDTPLDPAEYLHQEWGKFAAKNNLIYERVAR